MSNIKTIITIIILILIGGNAYFGFSYFDAQKKLQQNQITVETQKVNEKVLEFTKLFIKKVLQANSEIDFDTRLDLENLVRDLNDQAILDQWEKFTKTQTPVQAQLEVKNLLEMLISKLKA